MLGTGTPNADPERSGPSVAIVVDDSSYIVDFGPGVVRRASAAARSGFKALEPKNLRRAFLTHLHSDHTAGYADLIFTPWVLEREAPLEVYGPRGLSAMTRNLLAAYREDISIRLNGLEPANTTGYRVRVKEIGPGVIYRDALVSVTAFRVKHGSWPEAYGFKFQTPDRTIVVSGDCVPSDTVVRECNGCDVLVHEVYSAEKFVTRPKVWQRYHSQFHTSTTEVAGIAGRAGPKLLLLYHQLFWGQTDEGLVEEVKKAGYKGEVKSARDLGVY